jgi:hypothetical protein
VPPARRVVVESAAEHAARFGLEELAREQAALRRVATLVAEAAPAHELFAAVAEELGSVVLEADVAFVGRYEPDSMLRFVGGWSRDAAPTFVGQRVSLGGTNVSSLVFDRNAPARVDHLTDEASPATACPRMGPVRCGSADQRRGRLWGA